MVALLTSQILLRFGTLTIWSDVSVPVKVRMAKRTCEAALGGGLPDRSSVPPVTAELNAPAIASSKTCDTWPLWFVPQVLLSLPVPIWSQPRTVEKVSAGVGGAPWGGVGPEGRDLTVVCFE